MERKNDPFISLVIPIFKVEKYIAACIASVVKQTYCNYEIILVDDGSPDRSTKIAEKILQENGKSYRLIHQENKGLGEARNTGLGAAKGEWIYFLDSDDLIVPETMERLVSVIKPDTDLIFSNYRLITSQSEVRVEFQKFEPIYYSSEKIQKLFLQRKRIILAPGTLYRKSFLDANQLRFEKIPWSEDQHFMFRVLKVAKKVGYVQEPLYQYLQREGSIMRATEPQKVIEGYSAMKKISETYEKRSLFGKYVLSRWVMGTLNSTARMYDYEKWRKLYSDLQGPKIFWSLFGFPSIKVRAFSAVGIVSPKLYYKLNRK